MITRFSLIHEKSIKRVHHFFWFHRKTFTQIIEKTYPVSKNHFIAVGEGRGLFSYRQTSGEMFLHSLALSCPFVSFLTPVQVRTGQIIICRSIGYVEVICTEVYMKGSAIIELFELWEHIVCMCMYIMCVCVFDYVCVCMCACVWSKRNRTGTYTRCIKQMFPLNQGKKTRTSAKTFGFLHYFSSFIIISCAALYAYRIYEQSIHQLYSYYNTVPYWLVWN